MCKELVYREPSSGVHPSKGKLCLKIQYSSLAPCFTAMLCTDIDSDSDVVDREVGVSPTRDITVRLNQSHRNCELVYGWFGSEKVSPSSFFLFFSVHLISWRHHGRQRKCWMDIVKEWLSLPIPELPTMASRKKVLKRISADLSLVSP